jgi:hypothetical protein
VSDQGPDHRRHLDGLRPRADDGQDPLGHGGDDNRIRLTTFGGARAAALARVTTVTVQQYIESE